MLSCDYKVCEMVNFFVLKSVLEFVSSPLVTAVKLTTLLLNICPGQNVLGYNFVFHMCENKPFFN